jgi:hypothetical protein
MPERSRQPMVEAATGMSPMMLYPIIFAPSLAGMVLSCMQLHVNEEWQHFAVML